MANANTPEIIYCLTCGFNTDGWLTFPAAGGRVCEHCYRDSLRALGMEAEALVFAEYAARARG